MRWDEMGWVESVSQSKRFIHGRGLQKDTPKILLHIYILAIVLTN